MLLSLTGLERILADTFVGTVEHFAELPSTQDRARQGAGDPTMRLPLLVVADRQTSGRGRGDHQWWTGDGGLALSLLIDPAQAPIEPNQSPRLSLAVALAVIDVVGPRLPDRRVGLHWPNDVFVGEKKLAGALIERVREGKLIVGLGLNSNNSAAAAPAELRDRLTTLLDLTGRRHEHDELVFELMTVLAMRFGELSLPAEQVRPTFDSLCLQVGSVLTVYLGQTSISGRCLGIAADGGLKLQTNDGVQILYSGTLAIDGIESSSSA